MAEHTAPDDWMTKLELAAMERRVEREDELRREAEQDARIVEALRRRAPGVAPAL